MEDFVLGTQIPCVQSRYSTLKIDKIPSWYLSWEVDSQSCWCRSLKLLIPYNWFPEILGPVNFPKMECLWSSIRKIKEIEKAKKSVKFLVGLQARKFGVNDRFVYASFTQIISGVNDKSFAS